MSEASTSTSTDSQNSNDGNGARQGRQVAKRGFAAEINDATHVFKESDKERAPNFALLPSGETANRYFIAGTITEVKDVGKDTEYWQARIVDPTGTVYVYAGQYQPDAAAFLSSVEPPEYVAITAKPSTYETDDGTVNVSLRPETITRVDEATRNRWVAETIDLTQARLDAFDGDDSTPYVEMSREQYDAEIDIYREALDDAREDLEMGVVSGSDADPDDGEREAETTAQDNVGDGQAEGKGEDGTIESGSDNEPEVDELAIAAAVANADIDTEE